MVSDRQAQKIRRVPPHMVFVLFLFFAIGTSFLGYLAYEKNSLDKQDTGLMDKVLGHFDGQSWVQDDFTDGISGQTGTMKWGPLGAPGNWKKYSTETNITQGLIGLKATAPGGTFTSSILDQGLTYRAEAVGFTTDVWPNTTTTVHVRGANSEGGIDSAAWQLIDDSDQSYRSVCLGDNRYIQYKTQLAHTKDPFYTFWAAAAEWVVSGNLGLSGVTVTADGHSTTTSPDGSYSLVGQYETTKPSSFSITASKDSYNSQTKTATIHPNS